VDYGDLVGVTVNVVVIVDVGITVDFDVGEIVGEALGAVAVGLGVRKSYVSVPTRCGGCTPGVNVGRATCVGATAGVTGKSNVPMMLKTT
jgi:hypothetical protein